MGGEDEEVRRNNEMDKTRRKFVGHPIHTTNRRNKYMETTTNRRNNTNTTTRTSKYINANPRSNTKTKR
ncbi:hypothetical protein Bca52824_021030 [Brassica carinata]|uniref:Uncharacterized protein n=1 Tax=Brassica carinata TaxID=52824 RepID=A0A8X7VW53_BRACI|nr:hypothetical protein Bca52824_021030 [Brassica carinata]